jgi:transcriptional regulator with XRE-family HTH domain
VTWGNEPAWPSPEPRDGGAFLRELRHGAGLTLIELAGRLDDQGISIDAAHLQRIESGRIARPTAETLESILTIGLDAPYRLRRDVLDAYGYRLPWALPTTQEVDEMRLMLANELATATWPTYFMDYSLRIWGWNRYFPRLLGRAPDDPFNDRFMGATHIDIVLNPELGTYRQIANADDFAPVMLTMFKIQTRPHRQEPWCLEFVERIRCWPGIGELWDHLPDDADEVFPTQPVLPVEISVPGIDPVMRFRITLITFTHDPRFQVVHLIPYGAATLRECANWAEAAGEP